MTEPSGSQYQPPESKSVGGYAEPTPEAPAPTYSPPVNEPPAYAPPPGLDGQQSQYLQKGQYGQQPPPYSPAMEGQLTPDEKTWSMLAHLGGIVLGFLAPLIVMLTKGNESQYTRRQSVEALNFQITVLIGYVISTILMVVLIGFLLWPLLYIANIVFCILAGLAANKGEDYRYPMTIRLVK